ncbi:hypothetical protein [Pseudomonas oryzihabitans]|uniref:hypothetical protein n=1 Tax=Pseudomonas oryzihabitans TaxID=47885 RepID=UPI00165DCED1|nr:hypothetical protein [Pseudomonas psychrotolerans]
MIEVKSTFSLEPYSFPFEFSHGIFGTAIDSRSEYSVDFVRHQCALTLAIQYRQESLDIMINNVPVECHLLPEYVNQHAFTSVLIDSTSLDIPELALILKALHQFSGLRVIVLYVEPFEYTSGETSALNQEEFSLSEEISGFEGAGIPTISMPVDNDLLRRFIFFVGFEGGRLQSAIETYDISSEEARIFFGLPAFKPGWETKSIRRNLQSLTDQSFSGRIFYCSASSCTDALRSLHKVKSNEPGTINYVIP